jgi:hypothetical protein
LRSYNEEHDEHDREGVGVDNSGDNETPCRDKGTARRGTQQTNDLRRRLPQAQRPG